jgi:thioredoxin
VELRGLKPQELILFGHHLGVDVTSDTFEAEVVQRSHEVPVVVDFWADWCGPCHALTPVLERGVAERAGQVELAKVDVDANQELAARFGVSGIPAVKAFRNGSVVSEFVGVRPPTAVESFLDELTGPSEAERLIAELEARGELPEVVEAYGAGDHERALELLLNEIQSANGDRRDELRRLMVALFAELGQEHPVASQYRRRLAQTLY